MLRLALSVTGLSLDDDEVLEVLGAALGDVTWTGVDDRVLAVLHIGPDEDPVATAVQLARRVARAVPGAAVAGVDQDLVNTSDIARRVGASREAVRLWVEAGAAQATSRPAWARRARPRSGRGRP